MDYDPNILYFSYVVVVKNFKMAFHSILFSPQSLSSLLPLSHLPINLYQFFISWLSWIGAHFKHVCRNAGFDRNAKKLSYIKMGNVRHEVVLASIIFICYVLR
jgi:hypothetical protein